MQVEYDPERHLRDDFGAVGVTDLGPSAGAEHDGVGLTAVRHRGGGEGLALSQGGARARRSRTEVDRKPRNHPFHLDEHVRGATGHLGPDPVPFDDCDPLGPDSRPDPDSPWAARLPCTGGRPCDPRCPRSARVAKKNHGGMGSGPLREVPKGKPSPQFNQSDHAERSRDRRFTGPDLSPPDLSPVPGTGRTGSDVRWRLPRIPSFSAWSKTI